MHFRHFISKLDRVAISAAISPSRISIRPAIPFLISATSLRLWSETGPS